MSASLHQLKEYSLTDLAGRIETIFGGIVEHKCGRADMRHEDVITRAFVDYLRDVEPVMRYAAVGNGHAVVRFVVYKPITRPEPSDLTLVVDVRVSEAGTEVQRHQGAALIEAKLGGENGDGYRFQDGQLERLSARAAAGSSAFVAFYESEGSSVNPYLSYGLAKSRVALTPAGLVYDVVGSKLRGDVLERQKSAFSSTFALRWLQGYDLDLCPAGVTSALSAGVGSFIHAKVGSAATFELALEQARSIPNLTIPGYVMEICELAIARAFDGPSLDRFRSPDGRGPRNNGPHLGGDDDGPHLGRKGPGLGRGGFGR